jgi:hypothetical protein
MNVKVKIHLMPWEIDYALMTFTQLKKSFYHLSKDVNVTIESVLNLSDRFVDWKTSQLPKDFFKSKYNDISLLLNDYNHIKRTYEGDEIYGYLNIQRESISPEIDYYIGVCPDLYFSEHLLSLLIESARVIPNKYFVVTPQIYKRWDATWDEITDNNYINIPYTDWNKHDVFKTRHEIKFRNEDISLTPVTRNKWAWWFDLYSKEFYENMCPVHDDWNGYGPWDWYSIMLSEYAKNNMKVDFQQYLLKGQTILDLEVGCLKDIGFTSYYKKFLTLIPDFAPSFQRPQFEAKMQSYLEKGIQMFKEKNNKN